MVKFFSTVAGKRELCRQRKKKEINPDQVESHERKNKKKMK
jgi:hypothetical protein